jgi:hypothetical protein
MKKARGDRSKPVKSVKRSAGPAPSNKAYAKGPRGKPVTYPGGQEGYHKREEAGE